MAARAGQIAAIFLLVMVWYAPKALAEVSEQSIRAGLDAFVAAWNADDRPAIAELLADQFTRIENGEQRSANEADYLEWIKRMRASFSDAKLEIDVSAIKDGKAYTFWTFSAVNTGPLGGFSATNEKFVNKGFSIWAFDQQNKIQKETVFFDNLAALRQLGYSLAPPKWK